MKPTANALLLAFLMCTGTASAQQAQICCGSSNSTFLLGNTSYAPHTQSLYLPSDLVGEQSGDITHLYFRYGTTGEDLGNTLDNLMIRMGQTTQTTFANGTTFYTGLDTVLMDASYDIPVGTTGDWFVIPLQEAFPYNANQTLILDIWFTGSATTNFGTYGGTNTGRKIYALDLVSTTGSGSSTTWQDLGFDVQGSVGIGDMASAPLHIRPLPGNDQVMITWPTQGGSATHLDLWDVHGRCVRTETIGSRMTDHILDLTSLSSGTYVVRLSFSDGSQLAQRFVRL